MEHLTELGTTVTCPVALIIKNGKFLSGYRHYTPNKYTEGSVWTVPGGRCVLGETVEQTLRREVEEEVGIKDLEINEFLAEVPGAKDGDRVFAFLCTSNSEPKLCEPEKFSEWKWFGKEGVPDHFINPSIWKLLVNFLQ